MIRQSLRGLPVLLAIVALACSDPVKPKGDADLLPPLAPPDAPTDPLANLPATFRGALPCVACPARQYHLNMFPDQTFALHVEETGVAPGALDAMGTWVLSSDHRTLVLKASENASTEFFSLKDGYTLRRLDDDAKEIDESPAWDLRRAGRFEPLEVTLTMRGAYTYLADAASFTDCATGRRWPVASEGESAALERAYLGSRLSAGEPVIVAVKGRVASRDRRKGPGTVSMLVVDKFDKVFPGQTCTQRYSSAPLEGTEWRLVRVGTTPVQPAAGRDLPTIVLDPATVQFSGWGGCNRVAGSYDRNGGQINFSQAVQTRLTCKAGMDVDAAFVGALPRVRRWRVLGRILEFQDAAGQSLARFEAAG